MFDASMPIRTVTATLHFQGTLMAAIIRAKMKILLVGCYRFFWYVEVCARALATMGHDVVRFSWEKYFSRLIGRIEEHLLIRGWSTLRFEADLLKFARTAQPDVIWIWRGLHVRPIVVKR